MTVNGYARVSKSEQDLSLQVETLTQYGLETLRAEKVSGTSTNNRHELTTLLDFVREGDELVVTRLDRLAHSMPDLQQIVRQLAEKVLLSKQQSNRSTQALLRVSAFRIHC